MRWFFAVILGLIVLAGVARSQDSSVEQVPVSELTLLVAASPGGGYDRTAQAVRRALLSENLVSVINVEYSPGAGGLIGLAQFVESEPESDHRPNRVGRDAAQSFNRVIARCCAAGPTRLALDRGDRSFRFETSVDWRPRRYCQRECRPDFLVWWLRRQL